MRKTGIASLPLHYGRAPRWLTDRMKKLAIEIITIVIDEYSRGELLRRISNPYWFQALGCVLDYDWHSSGVTTVVTGILKSVIRSEEYGLGVAGGKGRASRKVPKEIERIGMKIGFFSLRALSNASGPHGYQSTGLSTC